MSCHTSFSRGLRSSQLASSGNVSLLVTIDQYLPTVVPEIQLTSNKVLQAPRVLHKSAQSFLMNKVKKEISLNKVRNYSVITCFHVICESITTAQLTEVRDYSKTLRNNHTGYLVFLILKKRASFSWLFIFIFIQLNSHYFTSVLRNKALCKVIYF